MTKNNLEKSFRAMKRFQEQMERINLTAGISSIIDTENNLFKAPISSWLGQQEDWTEAMGKEFSSMFSSVQKMGELFTIENQIFFNAEVIIKAQNALDALNTPAITAALSHAFAINNVIPKNLGSILKSYNSIIDRINLEHFNLSSIVSLTNNYQDLLQTIANSHICNNTLESLFSEDVYSQLFIDEDTGFGEISLTTTEEKELASDIAEICSSENWQQRLEKAVIKWQEKNPIIVRGIRMLITLIFLINALATIAASFQATVISDKAVIREKPSKNAPILHTVTKDEVVTIIKDEQYWYNVEFEHSSTEEAEKTIYRGFISKRTVKTIQTRTNVITEDNGKLDANQEELTNE